MSHFWRKNGALAKFPFIINIFDFGLRLEKPGDLWGKCVPRRGLLQFLFKLRQSLNRQWAGVFRPFDKSGGFNKGDHLDQKSSIPSDVSDRDQFGRSSHLFGRPFEPNFNVCLKSYCFTNHAFEYLPYLIMFLGEGTKQKRYNPKCSKNFRFLYVLFKKKFVFYI